MCSDCVSVILRGNPPAAAAAADEDFCCNISVPVFDKYNNYKNQNYIQLEV